MGGIGSGRPKKNCNKPRQAAKETFSVRLDKDIMSFILEQAEKAGVTKSFVANEVFKRWKESYDN